ncbi:SGNH/GDSL hydrolase family protein [Mameliella sediminis]|uniref:SGNH/GDSL hydrolase family protein n=1 Tax=Mameliella sediminis TaxID=2836866 RepID=UPI001C483B58|nr:SGNH/GDSL hydrolase family protein [Mameliella sediminis]MBV7397352.1 hypothetical protein [Mameliella sediminis]
MAEKSLVLHLGYHQTGVGLVRRWLQDHAAILAPHMQLYSAEDDLVVALREAALARVRGRKGSREALSHAARALAGAIRAQEAPVACLADETLLGPPLGHAENGHVETEIYPGLCPVIDVLMHELAAFDPVISVIERKPEHWLKRLHARAVEQGHFEGQLADFYTRFRPQVSWEGLREEIRFALQGRGRLAAWSFEEHLQPGDIVKGGVLGPLNIPPALLAHCRADLPVRPPAAPAEDTPPAPPPPAEALLLGGANALVAGGWGQLLQQEYGALAEVVNLSFPAGTSALGLVRMLVQGAARPGAAVLWELGINEFSHLNHGQPVDSLMYHLEWLLQICIRENRPFVPILTRNRMQATSAGGDPYVARLRALLADYGLTAVDASHLARVLDRGVQAPGRWYRNNAVYETDTDLPRRLAEAALMALAEARVPVAPPARAAHFTPLSLHLRTPETTEGHFRQPGVSWHFAPFDKGPRVATPGRALAAVLVASGNGPVIRLTAGDRTLGSYVTQIPHGKGIAPQQLRQLILGEEARGVEIPGGVVQTDLDGNQGTPIVQTMFQHGTPSSPSLPTGLVGFLCEEAEGTTA